MQGLSVNPGKVCNRKCRKKNHPCPLLEERRGTRRRRLHDKENEQCEENTKYTPV
jgi:hypothetical protein